MSTEIAKMIADICVKSLRSGGKVLIAGNGGSAAQAQHLAAELVGKLNFDRPPLAAIALTTDSSILTAVGNDYGYEHVFSRQIEAIGNAEDVFIAMSTSGKSRNIIEAIVRARDMNITVIGLTGNDGGDMKEYGICDILFCSSSSSTQEIQEEHLRLGHQFCSLIEAEIFQ